MENFKNKALEWAFDALKRTDEAISNFVSQASLPEPLDCKPGCHYCCYNLPTVTPPEALLIGYHVEQKFTNQGKKEISDRINKVLERINGISPYDIAMIRHELPCIFLEDGMCMVYSVRPVVCRTCTSTSAEHCKMIFETRNHRARLRCYQQIREIFHAVQTDLINRSKQRECQSDLLYVAQAIKDYFKHPKPIDAWIEGNIVFYIR
ncbi:MAG: YkgJ family cysteine cluster protein [Deltaproteobacteria bacterium]|jgi:Fe-S-cluster containining protein|nr:YkgJ family cysteine cluster protein [Deltaproteobacteria bacterium]MBW2492798.1 YkgJ family cysteine cluster protein [Deltaproteobacteria bacterium]